MTFAAVPHYIPRTRFKESSPALRFGMYLSVWQAPGKIESEAKVSGLELACPLSDADKQAMRALVDRQRHLAGHASGELLRVHGRSTSPFTTGLGHAHPLENGFSFLDPQGIPYLPGSGVKGVLRRACAELRLLGDAGWANLSRLGDAPGLDYIDVLFGRQGEDGDTDHFRGVLSFWDVIPVLNGDALMVDVMTPHQSHYIQGQESPHDSGNPNPIAFLTVPPESEFTFHVLCDRHRLARTGPALVADDRWKTLLASAFSHAFEWIGFGAKTAVGYGAMRRDAEAERLEQQADAARKKAARLSAMSEGARQILAFEEAMQQRSEELRGQPEPANQSSHQRARELAKAATHWPAAEAKQAAEAIELWLPKVVRVDLKEERKKLGLRQLKGEA